MGLNESCLGLLVGLNVLFLLVGLCVTGIVVGDEVLGSEVGGFVELAIGCTDGNFTFTGEELGIDVGLFDGLLLVKLNVDLVLFG